MSRDGRAATVRSAGPDGGTVLCDDGTVLPFPAAAVDPRLRALHPGQRVGLLLEAAQVTAVSLFGMTPAPPPGHAAR